MIYDVKCMMYMHVSVDSRGTRTCSTSRNEETQNQLVATINMYSTIHACVDVFGTIIVGSYMYIHYLVVLVRVYLGQTPTGIDPQFTRHRANYYMYSDL